MAIIINELHGLALAEPNYPPQAVTGDARMYAIAFDMDIESLRSAYGDPYNNAYSEIGSSPEFVGEFR